MKNAFLKKISITALTLIAAVAVSAQTASADEGTCGPYGSGTCVIEISIDKKVEMPTKKDDFKDNLDKDNPYSAGNDVKFKLTVKNSGNKDLTNVKVTDTMPDFFVSVSNMDDLKKYYKDVSYDSNTRVLKLTIESLKAGESKDVYVVGKIQDVSKFNKSNPEKGKEATDNFCGYNKAEVTVEDKSDEDQSQVCVQTKVQGATTLPQAGPEDWLPLAPFMITAILGVGLFIKPKTV